MATFHMVAKSQTGLKRLSTHIHKWKKPIWESYTPYDPNYIIFWTKQNYGDSKKTSVCKGLQGRKEKFLQNIFKKIKANQWVKVRKFNSIQTWVAQLVKNPPTMQEIPVWFLIWEVPLKKGQATLSSIIGLPCGSYSKESPYLGSIPGLGRSPEKEMATHSSIRAWRIPWTEESMGLQRVRHNWSDEAQHSTYNVWGNFLCCSQFIKD